uniref:NADH dehydrogenase subunit 4 n=1 Tax=Artyfechinostomum malayanum TaxID=2750923 RepID=UPI002176ABC4|nr:NADH dehydrogenase subunit 4 [Artyfechinostomum malayanum]UUF68159.1 NADH dehydrogenase subunit 4 [Artyfechinostomum malayanum]
MSFKKFDWYSWGIVAGVGVSVLVIFVVLSHLGLWLLGSYSLEWGGLFTFDGVSFYLGVLSIFLSLSLVFSSGVMSSISLGMLGLSVISSILCYCCVNGLWFWIFYEMSILPLLFLLIAESPYSERFIASWYLLGYVVVSSLPMLLCILYVGGIEGSYNFQLWSSNFSLYGGFMVYAILSVMFITKIPLPPFHVWLPIVHAEASSPVSMCLSGYIMKLGLLGVCRFSYVLLSDYIFSSFYVVISLCFAVLFFFSAARELDGKRWLAFLSLAHIVVVSLCLNVCGFDSVLLSFLYCLGHGLSAGMTFMLLWMIYDVSGTRNWVVLKGSISSSLLLRCLSVVCISSAASIPPTANFFSEVLILSESGVVSMMFVFMMGLYLFISGLVPLFLVGCLLSRHYSISFGCGHISGFVGGVCFLVGWCFMLFLVF